jgi:Fic family protein
MSEQRRYETQNPWITFTYRSDHDRTACLLGEAFSKCQHFAGTPLQPSLARHLAGVYMIRGAVATTAIEGNTLSEDEVHKILDGTKKLPESQQYLEQEIRNVVDALSSIDEAMERGDNIKLTTDWLKEQNARILHGLELEDHVVPGAYTTKQLFAGSYRAAPPEDVPYLMDRLFDFIGELLEPLSRPDLPPEQRFFQSFFAAVLGHLYIAWIHPFGDGNGRTARLLECAVLASSGVVPWVSSNLLSDHYNRTRSRYYQRLTAASKARDVQGFVNYAAQGFVDMLRDQIKTVQTMQRRTAWINYVHEKLRDGGATTTNHRRRLLVLALEPDQPVARNEIRRLTPELAELYAGKGDKTVTRDLNALEALDLIVREANQVSPNIQKMDAFLPPVAKIG